MPMSWYERSAILTIRQWVAEGGRPAEVPEAEAVHLNGWQIVPAQEIDRLGNELLRAADQSANPAWERACHDLIRADTALHAKGGRIRSWWTGARIETVWAAVHEAEAWTTLVLSSDELRSGIPSLVASVKQRIGQDDPRLDSYTKALKRVGDASAAVSAADREQLKSIQRDVRTIADVAHSKVRAFRNRVLLVGACLVLAAIIPVLAARSNPDLVPVCAAPDAPQTPASASTSSSTAPSATTTTTAAAAPSATSAPQAPAATPATATAARTSCPTNGKHATGADVGMIEFFGALGGLLTVVATILRLSPSGAPYPLLPAQMLLKIGAGALAGLLGVMLMQSGLINGLGAQHAGAVFVYAFIFGVAQDVVTRFADKKGAELLGASESKNEPTPTATQAPSTSPTSGTASASVS
jgi:hypothetical protein